MQCNLYQMLYDGFREHLTDIALQLPTADDWSYADLHQHSARMSHLLATQTNVGDRVLVQVDKCPPAVALYLACLRAGVVMVPLNTAYTARELDYFIDDAEPSLIICRAGDGARISEQSSCTVFTLEEFHSAALTATEAEKIVPRNADDLAAIVYTSGTTGRSKGAMLSHGNLASNAKTLHSLWGFEAGDVLLHALPIFHVHGLFIALNTAFLNGSRILFLEKFDTAHVLDVMSAATVMMGVPTFYTRLLASPDFGPAHYAHMRVFICGSAPLTEPTFAEFEQRTGQRILERYGMSEAGMITSNPLHGERLAGTVGFALPGVEVRVCDDSGTSLASGEVGIVEARGPNIFQGYWRMPDKTAAEFREDGWFISGDMGVLDSDGRLSLVGREKDLIISGGYNVYPKEVELVLDEVPGIAESAVIGVPHPDFGEAVVAVCVTEKGKQLPAQSTLQASMADHLARFKQPKQLLAVSELPRNTMGKVQKNLLREQYRDLFSPTAD
ncbi:malonyl-CoA synthase [Halieaceae bacterium IMCC14734]|uniref:Malonyl-CoA synthase n=1 Tax=Candidatus Litorirhabdus singularis TaxID=2518993 RepID=A0ABT3TL73_9GAMM|nr:AMP-binding protein [Candidatus Litorirhabdus singularis]MCX2983065.1 malonyl-CoA synthase [Candidatus Litorirhabdus singularis]